jgi:3-oxoacyl-[acyl-carrier protein] reductase
VAIVTGAGRGIGAAAAGLFAAEGARIAVCDIDLELANERAAAIRQAVGADVAVAFGHDLSVPSNCDSLVAAVLDQLGRVDILVNSAGVCPRVAIEDMTEAVFDSIMDVNLKSIFFLSRAAGDAMRANGWGRIVNLSSVGGRTGGVYRATVYAASKAGVISMTKAFARHFAVDSILVNSVAPGSVDTRMMHDGVSEAARQAQIDAVPLKRLSTPEEQAAVVAFLASPANTYVTGATVDANGGALMPD